MPKTNQQRLAERRERLEARNEKIRKFFADEYGVKRRRDDDVIREISDHYGISEATVENIIAHRFTFRTIYNADQTNG